MLATAATVLLVAGSVFFFDRKSAVAVIAPVGLRCTGNVCTGSAVVGSQNVDYSFTQHISPNGQFRLRLNGGAYTTTQLIEMTLGNMPPFTTVGAFANPGNGAVTLPTSVVNLSRTTYQRYDGDGCTGCIVDQVMTMQYAGLAAGTYSFNLLIVQNGSQALLTPLTFYVDAGAPGSTNESNLWAAYPGLDFPCADAVDNDLSYYGDCRDANCNGRPGSVGNPTLLCQTVELTCSDGFDNDGDGLIDCADSSCNGRVGRVSPAANCQFGNESGAANCVDNFDNDADALSDCLDQTNCWQVTASGCPATEISCTNGFDDDYDQSYSSAYDAVPTTGVDCKDYNCTGNAACQAVENAPAPGQIAPYCPNAVNKNNPDCMCFDGNDNDLDTTFDCADTDCVGVSNPDNAAQVCASKEFDLGQGFNYCANILDDDSDGPQDCADSDCKQKFGNCGPCPIREDLTYDACADAKDNDVDGQQNCADTDCASDLGALVGAARCAAENSDAVCGDGFSNDGDAQIDCADADCVGRKGPAGQTCQPAAETSCADTRDNDGDGKSDCADSNCYGIGLCAAKTWTNAACVIVPQFSGISTFTGANPTVSARSYIRTHVSGQDVVRLTGTGSYSSITIIIGDNVDPTKYYPYACDGTGGCGVACTVTGTGAGQIGKTIGNGHYLQLFSISQPVGGFDLQVTCPTTATPAAVRSYPISISVLKTPGDVPEVGDVSFSTTLLEATVPTVSEIELETGATIRVPYGGSVNVRPVPNDPGAGLNTSGICRCDLTIGASTSSSATGECIIPATAAALSGNQDASVAANARAEDGANNLSANYGSSIAVNVTPANTAALNVSPARPYFKSGGSITFQDVSFITASAGSFNATCEVLIRNTTDPTAANYGGPGPTATFPGQTVPGSNQISCNGTIPFPASVPADGEYFVTIRARDEDNDTVESNRRVIYRCDVVPAAGAPETVCSKADFDNDGATEGLFTNSPPATFVYSPTPYACDNCVALANDQTDLNANGIGDACEPNDSYGRCEIDTEIVCDCDSNAASCPSGLRCPGPSIKNNPATGVPKNPQLCVTSWGVCTAVGNICLGDDDCKGAASAPFPGRCRTNGLTACSSDATCGGVAGSCWFGAGQCDIDPAIACKRPSDCGAGGICAGANLDTCDNLIAPWVETSNSSLFSEKKVLATQEPPSGEFNSTYCITAKDVIVKFTSSEGCLDPLSASRYERPKRSNAYVTPLGRLDVQGLLAGKYGPVTPVAGNSLAATLAAAGPLNGRIFRVTGDATVGLTTIMNGGAGTRGNGTVIIDGGNLTFTGDVTYGLGSVTALSQLASIGWVVLDDGTVGSQNGNIYIDKSVTKLAGAFFAGGTDGIHTVRPPDTDGPLPLTVNGLMVARQFQFSRSYKSSSQGAESVLYDGRAVANPPPGLGDVTKTLPLYGTQ